jgi:hypothetical protein
MKFVFALIFLLIGCGSRPIIPDKSNLVVTRETPAPECENMGNIIGRTMTVTGSKDSAVDDLKEQAANKGATHLQVHQFSDMGTAVTGTIFKCP